MNIGLDLRLLEKNDPYSNFIFRLAQSLIISKKDILFNIFLDLPFSHINFGENTRNIIIKEKYGSLKEHTSLTKKLKEYNNDITIFFNYKKPVGFKDNYILFLPNLVNFHYPPKQNIILKYFNNYLLNQNSKNAGKIICFNSQIKGEINDKLNIFEDNIEILTPSFNKINNLKKEKCLLDIAKKYNILGKYFLYTAGPGNHKNLDRLIDIFAKFMQENINLSLIILDNSTIKDLSLRKKILEKKVQSKIFFIGDVSIQEKEKFYENSLGSIFPSLYDSFPFSMEEAINYNTPIIASNLKNTKLIFGDKINYFNHSNSFDIYQKLIEFSKNKKNPNYSEIFNKYNIINSNNDLTKIIDKII